MDFRELSVKNIRKNIDFKSTGNPLRMLGNLRVQRKCRHIRMTLKMGRILGNREAENTHLLELEIVHYFCFAHLIDLNLILAIIMEKHCNGSTTSCIFDWIILSTSVQSLVL